MAKKEKIDVKKVIDEDDEIKFLKKYRSLDVSNKILICMYVLIVLTIINMVLPYIVAFINSKTLSATNGKYDTSMFKTIKGSDIKELGSKDKAQVLFICSENYQECHDFIGTIQQAQQENGYVTNYLVADELNIEDNVNALLEYDNDKEFISKSLGQVPIVLVLKEGKLVEGWTGVSSYDNFKDFLKHAEVIK